MAVKPTDYEVVAASQTNTVLGPVGALGDILEKLVIIPAAVAIGAVSILDGNTSISVLVAQTLLDLKPIEYIFGMRSVNGAWKVTTGANCSVIGVGRFS